MYFGSDGTHSKREIRLALAVSDQQRALSHSKFWEYPTGSEKQPIRLLFFPISQRVRHSEASHVIAVEPKNMTEITRRLNPLEMISAPAFLFAGPQLPAKEPN
jgi:hypothetical protein